MLLQKAKPFNVLGVSQYFLPLRTPRAVRSGILVRYTQESGLVNWTILCGSPDTLPVAADSEIKEMLHPETRVLRTPCLGGRSSRHIKWITGRTKAYMMSHLPDARIGWLPFAVQCARHELATRPYDIIHSFSTPTTSHLVAGLARLRHRKPWVAFLSDPWSGVDEIARGTKGILNRFWERWVFASADALAFPSWHQANWTLSRYSERIRNKAVILPHCFDFDFYSRGKNPESAGKRKGKMLLLHAGTLHEPRTPSPLLKGIHLLGQQEPAAVADLDVLLLGDKSERVEREIRNYRLESTVRSRPSIPYLSSLALIQDADVLLLMDPALRVNLCFPSKLADYLGARRPIFGLTPPDGPTAQILGSMDQTVVSPWESGRIAFELREYRRAWREGTLAKRSPGFEAVKRFSVETVSEKLMDSFKRITA